MAGSRLPVPPNALLGRAADVAAVCDVLVRPGTRLVSLTGPPGVGKTRLAIAVGDALAERFAGGPVWVDLTPLRDPESVVTEIARAVDVAPTPAESLQARISAGLDGREVLLTLDNVEHVLDAAPQLGGLLASCPDLRILATSRERLRLAAEREYAVAPLPMPTDVDVSDLRQLAANPAVELLLARAPSQVALTAQTARSLADICVRLDGLPLALELAAARLRVFTPGELAVRLDQRTAVLTGSSRDAPGRHRDLRAALEWSHNLLPDPERVVFRHLSAFVGGWTIEAAEAVCGRRGRVPVVDAVESLLDKSLIQRVEGDDAGARFGMLMSIREFAAQQLDAYGETGACRDRHASYFADLARRWEATTGTSKETSYWLRPLGVLLPDLRAAFAHARAGSTVDTALWLAWALGWYWYMRGSLAEAAELVDYVSAAAAHARATREVCAAALLAAGAVSFGLGDMAAAERDLTRSEELSAAGDNLRRVAMANAFLGHVARRSGRFDDAARRYDRRDGIDAVLHNARGAAWAAHHRGLLARDRGEVETAEAHLREALRLFRERVDEWGLADCAAALAGVLLARGSVDESAALFGEALVIQDGVRNRLGFAKCLEGLSEVALLRGGAATAARLLGAAAAQREVVAVRPTRREQARLSPLTAALARTLGRAEADRESRAGATLPGPAAVALAAGVAASGPPATRIGLPAELTPRQTEVAALVAAGRTNRQIARALGISEKTTEIHLRNLMDRLQTPSRAGVAAWAVAHGLRQPP
jgi:predicted ATPase/DNA-binding CsgD family transcriptional regulator